MIPNKDIQWQKFPDHLEGVAALFGRFQTIMVVKSDKAINEHNPNGVMFGMFYAPSGTSEDLIFTGSKWCSYHECYHEIEIVSNTSPLLKIDNKHSNISKEISIEDISEYHVIEYDHMVNGHNDSPIYNN